MDQVRGKWVRPKKLEHKHIGMGLDPGLWHDNSIISRTWEHDNIINRVCMLTHPNIQTCISNNLITYEFICILNI